MTDLLGLMQDFGVALFIGALVGIEREHSGREGQGDLVSGLRTFILVAELGALAGWLAKTLDSPVIFVAFGVLVAALVGVGFVVESRTAKPGLTTEFAAVVTYLLGGAVLFGYAEVAVALAIVTSGLLALKPELHRAVDALDDVDLRAGLKLLFATFIVLPLLPREAVDPWGTIQPYGLWWLVILIAGISLVGYVAVRILGPRPGIALTGLFGGLVSSTAVTLSFARRSRELPTLSRVLAGALLLAWGTMFARVLVEVAVVAPPLLRPLLLPMLVMTAAGLTFAFFALRSGGDTAGAPALELKNPFRMTAAIQFALLFAAVLILLEVARRALPDGGLYVVAVLAGTTDVDAITLSIGKMATDGKVLPNQAVTAIVLAAASNTLVKLGLAWGLGDRSFGRWAAGGALVLLLAGGVALGIQAAAGM